MADDEIVAESPQASDTDSSNEDSEPEQIESLVAGRERRKTAGNRYDRDLVVEEALNDDEEPDEVTLLFAEDGEEEDEEFRSDEAEDDADMSSSDDDDQGPNTGADSLEGEGELQKQAKAERSKKRKADLALTSISGLRKKLKTVPTRLSLSSAPSAPKPSKKKERVTWVHSEESGRSSLRKQTIAHRAETIQRLKESEAQSKKLKLLKEKRDRERAEDAPKELTQADRLAEAARVERQNAKSLNRWETMEKKRQEEQAAKLAALKNRKLEGPVLTYWSAKMKWVPPKPGKHGPKEPEIVQEGMKKKPGRKTKVYLEQLAAAKKAEEEAKLSALAPSTEQTIIQGPSTNPVPASQPLLEARPGTTDLRNDSPANVPLDAPSQTPAENIEKSGKPVEPSTRPGIAAELATSPRPDSDSISTKDTLTDLPKQVPTAEDGLAVQKLPSEPDDSFLKGIHEFATLPESEETTQRPDNVAREEGQVAITKQEKPDEPMADAPPEKPIVVEKQTLVSVVESIDPSRSVTTTPMSVSAAPASNPSEPATIDESKSILLKPAEAPLAPENRLMEPTKLIQDVSDQAMIKSETHDTPQPPGSEMAEPEPTPEDTTRNLMILEKFDELSSEARQEYSVFYPQKKLTSKTVKRNQELCPITTLPVKYRDPATGIGYGNAAAYKKLEELRKHKFMWSSMLGCYVGGSAQPPARGVPEGFMGA